VDTTTRGTRLLGHNDHNHQWGLGGTCRVVSGAASAAEMYCDACGTRTVMRVPDGDNRERRVCPSCHKIHYINPKVVVGCLVECCRGEGDGLKRQVLLCRRGIDPCKGLWTLPAGFQECGESTSEGAARETREEANAEVRVLAPYAHLDIPLISQTYVIFRAQFKQALDSGGAPMDCESLHSPGEETLETQLFDLDSIPFEKLAFSSVKIVLQSYLEDIKRDRYSFHHGTIVKQPGVAADSPQFSLTNYMCLPTEHKL